jgi:hypothetical protein
MTKPSPSLLNQQSLHVLGLGVCDVMQFFVGDFVRPEYLHYLSQTGVMEAGESVDVFISHSPAL